MIRVQIRVARPPAGLSPQAIREITSRLERDVGLCGAENLPHDAFFIWADVPEASLESLRNHRDVLEVEPELSRCS